MRAYLDRTVDPPRLPASNALLERMRQARGKRVAQLVEEAAIDPSAVLAYEIHIEPDHFNDTSPEWLYELTTPLGEAYRAGDAEAVQALLARGALATRFATLSDGSTGSFHYTYVAYKLPEDAWTYRDVKRPVPDGDPRAPAARLLERAFERELEAAARGDLAPADRARALASGLLLAIERGKRHEIDRWLAAGADPTLGGPGGLTAIGLAILRRDHAVAQRLLADEAALEEHCAWKVPQLLSPWDLYPIRPLHLAALDGDAKLLRYLLDRGADPAQGFPRSYPLLVHFLTQGRDRPDPGCVGELAGPTVRRLRETHGDEAMMAGLSDYWSRDVLAHLERMGLVSAAD